MNKKTCTNCEHFQPLHGENKGYCWGQPPSVFVTGAQSLMPPTVKKERPRCAFYEALPEGEVTEVKTKQRPDTIGDAKRLRESEKRGEKK